MNKEERKIVGLAALGGMLELYDFAIYGMFAVYFAHQFFPSTNAYTAILETYMVFSLGFILRPLGGIIFSHIGDEYSRKNVLVYTILIMGGFGWNRILTNVCYDRDGRAVVVTSLPAFARFGDWW
ncbi:MAG: MFS transporter [Burkholderiales bacterium]|nr:MFS transporter [Burkholderiales bacterium]